MTDDRSTNAAEGRPAGDAPKDPRNAGGPGENAPGSLAEALSLRRNARIGLAVGIGLAALLYVPRLPVLDLGTTGSAGFYLGLALVLAATTAAAVTAGLSAKVMLEPVLDRRAWLRRGGTAAVVGGVLWTAVPALAGTATAGSIPTRAWRAGAGIAALLLLVGTVGVHLAVRHGLGPSRVDAVGVARAGDGAEGVAGGAPHRPVVRRAERVAYWVVVLALSLAAGNASGDAGPVVETAAGPLATPFLTASFLAFAAAVPFAATAEVVSRAGAAGAADAVATETNAAGTDVADGLPAWPLRALQLGALLATLGVAWLVAAGGWVWLDATAGEPTAVAAALALVTVPSGVGWAIAGQSLRAATTG